MSYRKFFNFYSINAIYPKLLIDLLFTSYNCFLSWLFSFLRFSFSRLNIAFYFFSTVASESNTSIIILICFEHIPNFYLGRRLEGDLTLGDINYFILGSKTYSYYSVTLIAESELKFKYVKDFFLYNRFSVDFEFLLFSKDAYFLSKMYSVCRFYLNSNNDA